MCGKQMPMKRQQKKLALFDWEKIRRMGNYKQCRQAEESPARVVHMIFMKIEMEPKGNQQCYCHFTI